MSEFSDDDSLGDALSDYNEAFFGLYLSSSLF